MFRPTFEVGAFVEKGAIIGRITDPFGKLNHSIKSSNSGYLINVNETPIVYQGDALFHISSKLKDTND
jgi:predicted deacylase